MITHPLAHPAGARRRALVVALAVLVPLTFAPSALAKAPTGPFAVFSDCPRFTSGVLFCIYSQTEGGEVKIGKTTVPINADKKHEIILQGGFSENETTGVESFVGAIDGNTLSKTPQNVPGGLAGLVNCTEISNFILRAACKLVFENGLTGVTATTELAKPASEIGINTSNLINEEGVALSLPVKVKLENPLLGGECYIGSSSSPVTLNLTTGATNPPPPNKTIKGKLGNLEFLDEFTLIEITNSTLVDNAFSAPAATGCGGVLSFILDPIIDAKLGLPSAAGKNTAIQNNRIRQASAENVIKSEA